MNVQPFDTNGIPSPWKEILIREVQKLKARPDVVAIGIAGSLAQGEIWSHSDIDIEVVLKGEHEFTVLNTEQPEGISVDFGFFGENLMKDIPYETRPIYDPNGIMTRELASRDLNELLSRMLHQDLDLCQSYLKRAEEALSIDPRSTLTFLHSYAWNLSEVLTVAAGENRTIKRRCSRLERAMRRRNREDLVIRCGQLYGFPKTLQHSRELLFQLREGYKEIWSFFKGKILGPRYMIQQPDSELWFRNRVEPVYYNDARDLVWIVYIEFPSVTYFLFRNLTDHERLPPDMFGRSEAFPEAPRKWVTRHLRILEFFDEMSAEKMLAIAKDLFIDAGEFLSSKLYLH